MLKQDRIERKGKNYIHSYSDLNFYIKKPDDDFLYIEAYDLAELIDNNVIQYVETDVEIRKDEPNGTVLN